MLLDGPKHSGNAGFRESTADALVRAKLIRPFGTPLNANSWTLTDEGRRYAKLWDYHMQWEDE